MDTYEIHATFAPPANVNDLKRWVVTDYGFQFHQIENFCRDGSSLTEYIGTYDFETHLSDTHASLESFITAAKRVGYGILRKKIECQPWNSAVSQLPAMYHESHTKIRGGDTTDFWARGFHVSRVNDSPWTTLTRRTQNLTRADFELDLQLHLTYLMNSGCLVGSTQVEYCLMDSNPQLDDKWMRT